MSSEFEMANGQVQKTFKFKIQKATDNDNILRALEIYVVLQVFKKQLKNITCVCSIEWISWKA